MKKIIYLLLVVFGMSTPKTMYAQEILSVQINYGTPCEGTYVNIYVDRAMQNAVDSIIWTKNGSKSALPAGWTYDSQIGHVDCYGFSVVDNGNYEVTCYMANGSSQMVNVQLSVNPNPNAGYSLITKCNSVEIVPSGGDYYLTYDENGGLSVPFYGDTLTGTGLLLPGGGFRAFTSNGCYSDVTIGQIWANPLVVSATPTKWSIAPGQSSTITASANWPTVMSKTKWFKNNLLYAQGCNTLTVTDTGLYKVQMRATAVSGGCVKAKQIRIKAKIVTPGARVGEEGEFESVEGQESILDLQVGPNPAQDQIQMTGYDENIEIFDLNGRLVNSFVFDTFAGNDQPQTIDVSSLPNGMYLVRSGEQTVKLLVQR